MFTEQNQDWETVKDHPVIVLAGFQKEEWDALGSAFDGAEDKEHVQAHMKANPAHAQLVFAGSDRMGYGMCLMGKILEAFEVGGNMTLIKQWASEVGVELHSVTGSMV